MKNYLKLIKSLLILLSIGFSSQAQDCVTENFPEIPNGGNQPQATYDSKNGWFVPCSGTLRTLVIFAEIDYSGTGVSDPASGGRPNWQEHELPDWANELFDPEIPSGTAQGMVTRYYQQASSGQFNLLGDYLVSPTNGGIFRLPYSLTQNEPSNVCAAVNAAMGGVFTTNSGLSISDFDNWTMTIADQGVPKITPSIESPHKFDHVVIMWRNKNGFSGNGRAYRSSPGNLFGISSNSFIQVGSYNDLTTAYIVTRHEFGHLMYGGNDFHCAGGWGDAGNYWIPIEHGWSNMSLHWSSLQCWNAWDRQRMDWKAPGNIFNPAARNQANTSEVDGDLDANNISDAGVYTLRDFVTTGDAIRIRLPFINTLTEYPEFIWIENHNTETMNGSPFDKFHYQNDPNTCGSIAPYGLYMYMQIDKDVRQSNIAAQIYSGYADYLRPLTADGFYERSFDLSSTYLTCIGGNSHPFFRNTPNPFTGGGDQDFTTIDLYAPFGQIDHGDFLDNAVEN